MGKLRYGMIGGGEGAFIGDVHRKGAMFDGLCELTAGCFSRRHDNNTTTGRMLGLDDSRIYVSYAEMAESEAKREDGIDFAVVATPNDSHYEIVKAFLVKGIPVMCDKPLAFTLSQGEELAALSAERGLPCAVTYAFSGYPMVKQAREMIRRGDIGQLRSVVAEYAQEGIANPTRKGSNWRTDPMVQGESFAVADIGTHIEHTVHYMTGLRISSLCAMFSGAGLENGLETDAKLLVRYEGGTNGMYWCTKLAIGSKNRFVIRVHGSKGTLEWEQEQPNDLRVCLKGEPVRLYSRGREPLYPEAAAYNRLPGGHAEGTYESFANLYRAYASAVGKWRSGLPAGELDSDYPSFKDGVYGLRFIDACLRSAKGDSSWVSVQCGVAEEMKSF
ncbi:Gfo/Idh/MocA family protein [Paenibacillus mesophilus]|uniref:Gfo/Idh/MocA family protein n=1 Tax=Paenibacillus mesophilus TaxID=2582849 RepID=UPI0013054836|nr:Gfo/Idh/MocA family oxidoreductase [Paenibacillus mesophilus]